MSESGHVQDMNNRLRQIEDNAHPSDQNSKNTIAKIFIRLPEAKRKVYFNGSYISSVNNNNFNFLVDLIPQINPTN